MKYVALRILNDLGRNLMSREQVLGFFYVDLFFIYSYLYNTVNIFHFRVLVMSGGEVIEFDSPQNLRQDKNSAFYALVTQNDTCS